MPSSIQLSLLLITALAQVTAENPHSHTDDIDCAKQFDKCYLDAFQPTTDTVQAFLDIDAGYKFPQAASNISNVETPGLNMSLATSDMSALLSTRIKRCGDEYSKCKKKKEKQKLKHEKLYGKNSKKQNKKANHYKARHR